MLAGPRSLLFQAGFGVATAVFALLVLAAWPLPAGARDALARAWCRAILAWLRLTCGIRHGVTGAAQLPDGPAVILAHHESAWETIAFRALFRLPLSWVIKRSLFRIPFYGWALRALGEIGIDRAAGRQALRQIETEGSRRLRAGRWVVVFPEGTRMAPGEIGRFGQGGARLACAAGVPVVPVAVDSGRCWPRAGWRRHAGVIRVAVGPAIETGGRSSAEVTQAARAWIVANHPAPAWGGGHVAPPADGRAPDAAPEALPGERSGSPESAPRRTLT